MRRSSPSDLCVPWGEESPPFEWPLVCTSVSHSIRSIHVILNRQDRALGGEHFFKKNFFLIMYLFHEPKFKTFD